MIAVALVEHELPLLIAQREDLARRVHARRGEREFRFYYRDPEALLPVWVGGKIELVKWGNRDRKVNLPMTPWTWKETVEEGKWSPLAPEPVEILGTYGLEGGVWFRVRRGFRGLLVRAPDGDPHVYVVCEPPTRYYRVMTRGVIMPVLIDEVI
jgi:hypothetical protein